MPKQVGSAFKDIQTQAGVAGQGMGSKMAAGLGNTLKAGALGVAAAAGATAGVAFAKGFQRLSAIDGAQGKLRGLGHDAGTVQTIMDNALASVKGTAFGLGDAAGIAAGSVAAGIKPGQDLERTLKLVGDAAAIAGTDLGSMGAIFNKVAASNKIQGDVIAQLSDAGIPVIQMLGKELGKSSEEVVKLASDGKINFETFQKAMEKGLGGAALESGNTVSGAFKNMNAALGRLGAEALKPTFARLGGGIGGVTSAIDLAAPKVSELAKALDDKVFAQGVPKLTDAWKELSKSDLAQGSLHSLVTIGGNLKDTFEGVVPPAKRIAEELGRASAAIGVSGWQTLLATAEALSSVAASVLVPALETVAGLMESNTGIVTGLVAAWLAFKTIPGLISRTGAPLSTLNGQAVSVSGALRGIATATGGITQVAGYGAVQMGRFGSAVQQLGTHSPLIGRLQRTFMDAAAGADRFGRMAGTAAVAGQGLATAGGGLMSALGGPWGVAITGATVLVGGLARKHAEAAAEARAQEQATKDLATALDQGSGAITAAVYGDKARELANNGSVDQAEKLGITGKELTAASLNMGDYLPAFTEKVKTAGVAAVEASQFFKTNSDKMSELGLTAQVVSGALAGNADDIALVNAQLPTLGAMTAGGAATMDGLAHSLKGGAEENYNLVQSVAKSNQALTDAQKIQADFQSAVRGTAAETRTMSGDVAELGLQVREVPDAKSVVVDIPTEDQRNRLLGLGMTITDIPGTKTVTVTAPTEEAAAGLTNFVNQQRTITVKVRAEAAADAYAANLAADIANGGYVHYADGGIQNLPGQAKIQPGSGAGLVQWAEGETGGEAFIPLAQSKRGRSTSILADVAARFGYGLTAFAEGGINGIQAALNAGRSNNGVKYLWGGTGPNGWDCSGWVGWLQQIAMGIVGSTKRLYTTYSLLDGSLAGLQRGLGPAGTQFQVGVSQEHMAATVGGQPAESGGSHGDSRIGAPAVGATDSQFTNWFHLPNSMIAGGVANSFTPGDRRAVEWTEDDDLYLEEAGINVRQEQDRRNEVQEKLNKGEATQAELDKADLDVKKAQKKVLDLQKQKEAAGAGKYVAPEAPGIAKAYTEREMERLDAQLSVDEANERRNEVYDDPEASERDRLRADMDLVRAQNSLAEAIKGTKDGKDYSARGIAKTFLDRASDAALDGVFGQIPFGVGDSRWVTTDWNSLIPEGDWTQEQVDSQLGVTPGQGDWMSALSKNLEGAPAEVGDLLKRVKVFDNGGWLEPGELGINLSARPEPIFNSPDQLRQFAGNLAVPERPKQIVDNSVVFNAPVTTADPRELERVIRTRQQNQTFAQIRR
ncbi:tape measure protein [Rhodococcus sp. TAF43]|uniref:tape measure protein n=1 Tax=Rhodococcus sp. TAF43 TaxID=3237483 RepID=UPI003F9D7A45